MADVMIVLLIIFMVMTPIIDKASVALPPAAHGTERKDEKPLVLTLDEKGDLTLGDRRLGPHPAALREVARLVEADPLKAIAIKADRRLTYAPVGAVLEACRNAGAENVQLATDRPEMY
jgi:biopolymer transport protein ExbD